MVRDSVNVPLDEDDIAFLKTYGIVPYSVGIKKVEKDMKELAKKINDLCRIKESDTGLAPRNPAKMVRFIDNKTLDEDDIVLLKTYRLWPYSAPIKKMEREIKDLAQKINDLCRIKESDTGLAPPSTSMGSRIR